MIDWAAGYSATWRVTEVDPVTWADSGEVTGVRSVSIERSAQEEAPLLESGTVTMDMDVGEPFRERYLRVVMVAHQSGMAERVDVATLLCSATSGQIGHGAESRELVGHSVLWPASTRRPSAGTYVPKGADGAAWVADALRACLVAPVVVDGSFALEDAVVLDVGTSVLDAVWSVLNAGGYCLQVDGNGTVRVLKRPTEPNLSLEDAGARLLHNGIRASMDMSQVPNRYVAVDGSVVAEAVNDDPNSVTSAAHRGYSVDMVDTSPTRRAGESLYAYALRRLEEESVVRDSRSYTREYWPGVLPLSVVRGTMESVGTNDDLRVVRQSLTCDKGIVVAEEAESEVRTWTRGWTESGL